MRGWTLLFAALTAVLSVALALQVRENRRLSAELVALTAAKSRAAGIEAGQALAPFSLHDAAHQEVRVDFAGGHAGTVLLFLASGCEACASSIAYWRGAVEQAARPDVRVLCIQTDEAEGGPLAPEGLPASLLVPLPPVGWLAALPAVPATFVVDSDGTVVRAWYGEIDGGRAQELAQAIVALPLASAAPR
jgi:peroxiredoxin